MQGQRHSQVGGRAFEQSAPRQAVKQLLLRTLPRRLLVAAGSPKSGAVALTFDDGPHPEHTPPLLDRLAELGVPATFFPIGEQAARHPQLIARIARDGHAVGHHSYTHSAPAKTSAAALYREAKRTITDIRRVSGRAPTLFRPPLGALTPLKLMAMWRLRQTVVLWNVDPRDYARVDADDLAEYFRTQPLAGGDIVLLHDVHPLATSVLGDLVDDTRRRGLEFVTVDGLL